MHRAPGSPPRDQGEGTAMREHAEGREGARRTGARRTRTIRTNLRPLAPWLVVAAALALAGAPAHAESEAPHGGGHWGYTGEAGPAHWGEMSEAYETCAAGRSQSPIDIGRAGHADSAPPRMQYGPTPLKIVNNGHTIQVNYGAGSTLVTDGKTYKLAQFHFHSPSEHHVDGKPRAMEAHLVHQADDGSLAVVGLLLQEGGANPFLEKIWPSIPTEVGHEVEVPNTMVNAADLVPARPGFFHYSGSLTTPPCSEGVRWFVIDEPGTVSEAQVKRFLGVIHENARPVQPLNGRVIEHRM
jgi:carbonic anhydrase